MRKEYIVENNKRKYPTVCSWCGERLHKTSFELKRSKNFFCVGKTCRKEWMSINATGENNPTYKRVKVKCSNPNCDKFTFIKKSKFGKFKNYFCDIKCKAEYQSLVLVGENHPTFTKETVNCSWCGKEKFANQFELTRSENFFCDKVCHGKWDSVVKIGCGSWNWNGGKKDTNCVVCNKDLKRKPSRIKDYPASVCSFKCLGIFVKENFSGENSPSWRGGLSSEEYPSDFNIHLKTIIRERDEFICMLCGDSEDEKENHSIHHIDYKKENCSFRNLISLCRSCHTKTTNGSREYWTQYFQRLINEKYNCKLIMEDIL